VFSRFGLVWLSLVLGWLVGLVALSGWIGLLEIWRLVEKQKGRESFERICGPGAFDYRLADRAPGSALCIGCIGSSEGKMLMC